MTPTSHCRVRRLALAIAAASAATVTACARPDALVQPGLAAVALTGGPGTSMVYLARTSGGVIAIDLGWWGNGSIDRRLRELGATRDSVTHVFLTHTHRDHVAAWPRFRGSTFHVASAERPLLTGERVHHGLVPREAEKLRRSRLPRDGEVEVREFSGDTAFAFGADTLRAYLVTGHTAGSAVYLFRGVLFAGDAITWSYLGGYGPARRIYTDDRDEAIRSLDSLWARLPAGQVRLVCTAHGRCEPFGEEFLRDVRQWGR